MDSNYCKTSISANTDGLRDTASRKIANTTLHANWNHPAASAASNI